MELDAVTLSTIVGAVVTGVLGAMGVGRLHSAAKRNSTEDPAESIVTRSEAVAAAAAEGRLVRIEAKVDQVLVGQQRHEEDDRRRFSELEQELRETRHSLKDAIAPLPVVTARVDRLEDDLRVTRRQAGLDSSVHDVRGR